MNQNELRFRLHFRRFSVKSYYRRLMGLEVMGFPWKSIFRVEIPRKVVFLSWTGSVGCYLDLGFIVQEREVLG